MRTSPRPPTTRYNNCSGKQDHRPQLNIVPSRIMPKPTEKQALDRIQNALQPLTDAPSDYDLLLQRIGEAALVLIGEASHGTQEFYQHRAEITKRLIQEK